MNFCEISHINREAASNASKFIQGSENRYEHELKMIAADLIKTADEKPIILLAGPSGSGKTTSAMKIEHYMDISGHETHTISLDNYFLSSDDKNTPLTEDGKLDLESPFRLDIELLAEHLEKIYNYKEIMMPTYDFISCKRGKSYPFHRKKGELVILEGIHALNPLVTGSASEFCNTIYVSVRTRIKDSSGNLLHPQLLRLMRRMVRDKLFRGFRVVDSIANYASVNRGEAENIMPFKHLAKYQINTFIEYEACVYRDILLTAIESFADKGEELCTKIAPILRQIVPISPKNVPASSLLREFIGGGTSHF